MVGGMTPLSETDHTSFALGADYERRFTPVVGVGIVGDLTFGDHERGAVVATGVTVRPVPSLRLSAGPGFEVVEITETTGGMTETKNKLYFLIGLGAAYEFHAGAVSLSPTVFLDFVGETKTNLTYGVAVGYGF